MFMWHACSGHTLSEYLSNKQEFLFFQSTQEELLGDFLSRCFSTSESSLEDPLTVLTPQVAHWAARTEEARTDAGLTLACNGKS